MTNRWVRCRRTEEGGKVDRCVRGAAAIPIVEKEAVTRRVEDVLVWCNGSGTYMELVCVKSASWRRQARKICQG